MKQARTLAMCVFGIVCSAQGVAAQDLSRYRSFELGANVAAVSTLAGVAVSEAKTLHQRPAVLQDLEWRPSRWVSGSTVESTDPVERMTFSFYDNQLFRIAVDYGRDRTEGMTGPDMIEAISAVYGTPLLKSAPAPGRVPTRFEAESGTPIARWGDGQHAAVLYRTSSYGASFRVIVTQTRLDDLARKAEAQAIRLDDQEAPRRETVRQQKERDDAREAAEKARIANKLVFRP